MQCTKETVIKLINQGTSIRNIADKIGLSYSGMRSWLKRSGMHPTYMKRKTEWTELQLVDAVAKSETMANVLRLLNLGVRPCNYDTINRYCRNLGIDTSHFTGSGHKLRNYTRRIPTKDLFIPNCKFSPNTVKNRLKRLDFLPEKCSICGINEWHNKKLVLVLDHVDGNSTNCSIENLRWLCPNCNSQQPTFCRKKRKERKVCYGKCLKCGEELTRSGTKFCSYSCANTYSRKTRRPPREKLIQLLISSNYTSIGKKFGVTGNAVKKWAKTYNIDISNRLRNLKSSNVGR